MNGSKPNGRGHLSLRDVAPQLPEEQTFQAKLRAAMFDGVSEEDAKQVVQAIVKSAKEGNAQAQKMFFDYLTGAGAKPQNVTVNVVADVETAARIASQANGRGQ